VSSLKRPVTLARGLKRVNQEIQILVINFTGRRRLNCRSNVYKDQSIPRFCRWILVRR
jgi:hypothetical protein